MAEPHRLEQEVWRHRHADGHIAFCQIRTDSTAGAAWVVIVLENDELLLSQRCADEAEARYVAKAFKRNYEHTGRIE